MANFANLAGSESAKRVGARKPKQQPTRHVRLSNPGARVTCKTEVALIADYITATLAPATQRAFERHLTGCQDCAAFLQTYKKTLQLTQWFLQREAAACPKLRLLAPE